VRLNWVCRSAAIVAATTLLVAFVSPLEGASHRTLTAHMVQHVLLIAVAAPAIALALPRSRLDGPWWYALAAAAVALQTVVVVGWHTPALFDAALQNDALHALEHLTMTASAAFVWWVAARAHRWRGDAVIALFISVVPLTVLGVGLLLSGTPWYAAYRDVSDQQVAGAVMWAVGGGLTAIEAVVVFVRWLQTAEPAPTATPAAVAA
jgi:putative membrane protein